MTIPVYKPYIPEISKYYAENAIESTWISSHGKYIDMCERFLEEYLGVKHVLLCNSGTAAAHLVAKAMKKKYPHVKKVLVPNSVYVAAWNSLLFDKNLEIVPTYTDYSTWNMDLYDLDEYRNSVDAVLIVHNLGNIMNVPDLKRKYPQLVFIEDNCEGLFGTYEGKCSGTESFASSISFYANKIITMGEGGAFLTNDDEAYEYARLVWGQGQSQTRFIHSDLGYNYRPTNVQAAILWGQLMELNSILKMKQNVFSQYYDQTHKIKGRVYQGRNENNTVAADWMFPVRVLGNPNFETARAFFESRGIDVRPFFFPINAHGHLKHHMNDDYVANILQREVIILPSYPELTSGQIEYIGEVLNDYTKTL